MNTLVQLYGRKCGESAVDKIYYAVLGEGVDPREYVRKLQSGIVTGYTYTIEATVETSAEPIGIFSGAVLRRTNPEKWKAFTREIIKEAIL